jgi:hypothetical protein
MTHISKTFLILFLTFLFSFSAALAQTGNSDLRLTSSPLPINLKVKPGDSITTDIKI